MIIKKEGKGWVLVGHHKNIGNSALHGRAELDYL